jgi:hypothetical protein
MKAALFLALSNRLKEMNELAWIDWDWGQLEVAGQVEPVQFDAALISFPDVEWFQETRGAQNGNVVVQVRIGIDVYEDLKIADGATAPNVARNYAIQKLDLPKRVFKNLHGYSTEWFTPLQRIRSGEERRDDGLKVFVETYLTNVVDNAAAREYEQVMAQLNLTGSIEESVEP